MPDTLPISKDNANKKGTVLTCQKKTTYEVQTTLAISSILTNCPTYGFVLRSIVRMLFSMETVAKRPASPSPKREKNSTEKNQRIIRRMHLFNPQ